MFCECFGRCSCYHQCDICGKSIVPINQSGGLAQEHLEVEPGVCGKCIVAVRHAREQAAYLLSLK